MIQFLVINGCEDSSYLPFREQFKLFNDSKTALSHAESIGYKMEFIRPDMRTVGVKNSYICGNVNISILILEAE